MAVERTVTGEKPRPSGVKLTVTDTALDAARHVPHTGTLHDRVPER